MGKILSQDEIDALLGSAGVLQEPGSGRGPKKTHFSYNFRRPDRISKEQIRSLNFMHDRFARNVAQSLSAYLRTVTDVTMVSVEQFNYSEFLMSLPDPTAFYAISMQPFDGMAALELSPAVAFTMIDRMLGGNGSVTQLTRALTEIEQNVIDSVVRLLLENLTELWKPIAGIQFNVHGRETRPQLLQVSAPNEIFILLGFDIRVGEARGVINFALPVSFIEAAGGNVAQGMHRTRKEQSDRDRQRLIENIGRIPVEVSAGIDSQLCAADVLELREGDVISLGRSLREPVDVKVLGSSKFAGRLLRLAHSSGVRVETQAPAAALEGAA